MNLVVRSLLLVGLAVVYYVITNELHVKAHSDESNPVPDQLIKGMGRTTEMYFRNSDGIYIYTVTMLPKESAKGILFYVHGLESESQDIDGAILARYAIENNLIFSALDQQGHGRSGGIKTHVLDMDDFIEDIAVAVANVKRNAPELPVFLVGQSLGGFLSARFAESKHKDLVDNIILLAPALIIDPEILTPWKVTLLNLLCEYLPRLTLPSDIKMDTSNMARSEKTIQKMLSSEYRSPGITITFAKAFMLVQQDTIDRLGEITKPILFIHGEPDGVCDVESSKLGYRSVGSTDKTLNTYEGALHIYGDDPLEAKIFGDIFSWVNERL